MLQQEITKLYNFHVIFINVLGKGKPIRQKVGEKDIGPEIGIHNQKGEGS